MVPHLLTALKGPLLDLERRFLEATPQIERWLRLEWQEHTPPFYCSVDIRNAGFKLAPVDTDLLPGDFDNLSDSTLPLAVQAAMAAIEKYCPDARNLLLIPESRPRGPRYFVNVQRLAAILRQTGLNVRFGSLDPDLTAPRPVVLPDGASLLLEPLRRHGRRVGLVDFDPCSVLLNTDLSAGQPAVLTDLTEQVLLPPLHAGWAVRRRSQHLASYKEVAKRFSKMLDIDPWLIDPLFIACAAPDWHSRDGEDSLATSVDQLLRQMRSRYREYGVQATPFVVLKADRGTGGLDSLAVRDAAELRGLLRRGRAPVPLNRQEPLGHELVLQEGVPSVETVDQGVADPVVYLIDRYVVGGFYRVHSGVRGAPGTDPTPGAPGTQFLPLPFATSCNLPDRTADPDMAQNRFYAYGVVARLAMLAASLELERTDPDQSLYG